MSEAEEIYVLNKRLKLIQAKNGFRTCLDSVMLAAACPAQEGANILDIGCGVGGAGLCVLARVAGAMLTGIDIQSDHIELAVQNAKMNNMDSQATFISSDIRDYKDNRFDHAICNPPYLDAGDQTPSPSSAKATAHVHQDDVTLRNWIDGAVRNLKSKGSLTIIHRADQSDKILQNLEGRFGGTEIIPLWPKQNTPAKRVIIRTYRDSRASAILHPGIVLHQENGDYTEDAEGILRRILPIA